MKSSLNLKKEIDLFLFLFFVFVFDFVFQKKLKRPCFFLNSFFLDFHHEPADFVSVFHALEEVGVARHSKPELHQGNLVNGCFLQIGWLDNEKVPHSSQLVFTCNAVAFKDFHFALTLEVSPHHRLLSHVLLGTPHELTCRSVVGNCDFRFSAVL